MSFALTSVLWAQDRVVTGKITSETGEALPGVNVLIQGTTQGTTTDVDGNYSLNVPSDAANLIYSFVGYRSQVIAIGNRSVIDIGLQEDIAALDEIVVTAFGVERDKKAITYAAQNVNVDDIAKARETNVVNSLAGKVAGLDLVKSSAGVGSASRVILRGNRSVAGNNQPLYIVDGVPVNNSSQGNPSAEGGGVQGGDGISNINPDDIESVTVLKGPNATALYGSRAANGAIVITTKTGTLGQGIGVEFNTNASIDKAYVLTNFQNVYGQGSKGTYVKNGELAWGPRMDGQLVDHWSPNPNFEGPAQYAFSPHNNFEDFFRTGSNLANTLTLTGGSDDVRGYFSYTNTLTKGIVPTNDLQRNNVNVRVDGKLSEKLSFDAKITYFNQKVDNRLATGDSYFNPMRALYRQPSNISLDQARDFEYIDETGTPRQHYWNPNTNGGENVYWMINRTSAEEIRNRVIGLASLRYQFTDNISLQVRSSVDQIYENTEGKQYHDTYTIADAGNYQLRQTHWTEMNNDFLLNYNNMSMFGSDLWSLDVSVGGNLLYQKYEYLETRTDRLLKPNLFVINNTSSIRATQDFNEKRVHSLYAYASVGYNGFLFLDITGRNDWSSTLPQDNWSYFYPSVGLTWVLTDMMDNPPSFLTYAKLRGNYAEVGNDTSPYQLQSVFNFAAGGNLGYAGRGGSLPAESLEPENTKSWEFGFDTKFLDNRLGLNFTWYKTNTFNQLLQIPLPRASGFTSKFINAGNIQNNGIELVLTATPVTNANFTWDMMFNYAMNDSEVIELTDELTEYTTRGRSWMTTIKVVEGQPYGQIFTRAFVRNDAGRVLINDLGLPVTTPGQTVPMGNYNPDWFGGITNNFTFKGVRLDVVIDMRMGGDIFSFTESNLASDGFSDYTLEGRDGFIVDGVKESDGSENDIEVTAEEYWLSLGGRNSPTGEPFRYDASFVRLREVVLGYTLNFESSPIRSIDLSLYGRNLGFLYNASEVVDPNMNVGTGNNNALGLEGFGIPSTNTYGINARFKF
ncbi:MAG: SusC/RagA family TonB-linked outer membrane protein [Cyclobacteriaceae bacterium]|nr:MAG: SusC/RagA family TonB-linked outer membrane protein [Cyclobacteriaceae bacterium]